jgi:hypothetical protein
MTRTVLKGLNGSNPLGFMASVGLLRLLGEGCCSARLGFAEDGTFRAGFESDSSLDIVDVVLEDVTRAADPQPWRLEYEKTEKRGIKKVADLKAPPEQFAGFLASAIGQWVEGQGERAEYAAAYGTDIAVDGKKNTKPTAFHFTAANQQFLGVVEEIRERVTRDWVAESLDDRPGKTKPGSNLRWDPDAERSRALMGVNPNDDGTVVSAPLEWLAFRALPTFRCVPIGDRIVTCGVTGRRQDELRFHWPLWSCGASYATVRSLVSLTARWVEYEKMIERSIEERRRRSDQRERSVSRLRQDLQRSIDSRRARGMFAICTSVIRRTAQGFGNFGPAHVQA